MSAQSGPQHKLQRPAIYEGPSACTQLQPRKPRACTRACAYMLTCTVCPRQSPSGAKINMPGVQNDSPSLAAMRFLEQVATGRPGGPESGRHEKGQVLAHPAAPWWHAATGVGGSPQRQSPTGAPTAALTSDTRPSFFGPRSLPPNGDISANCTGTIVQVIQQAIGSQGPPSFLPQRASKAIGGHSTV